MSALHMSIAFTAARDTYPMLVQMTRIEENSTAEGVVNEPLGDFLEYEHPDIPWYPEGLRSGRMRLSDAVKPHADS